MSAVAVSLSEWQTLSPDPGTPLAQRGLSGKSDRQLAEELKDRIEVLELARGIELRATSFVGRFRLGEITVTVQPKISGAPLLTLLKYAYGLRNLHLYESVAHPVTKWSFQDLLIQQLAAEVSELLARGIHRDYERYYADLNIPRGRIDFNRFVRTTYHTKPSLPCIHYPRSDDTILNQVVLAGIVYAAALTTDSDILAHLRQLIEKLAQTVSLKKLNTTMLNDAVEAIDRRTEAYRPAVVITDLLFGSRGVSLEAESTRISLPGFLFDMNRFFQALLSRFLHNYLYDYEIQDEYRLKELFCYDPYRNPQRRRAPVQKPDFVIRRGHRIAAILDAKYRDLWENPLPPEMLYQLSLYVLATTVHGRKAVILYPTLSSEAREQAILIREPTNGFTQATVILRPVNLMLMDELLRTRNETINRRRAILAHQLSFGTEPEV